MGGAHVFRALPAILRGKGEVFNADPRLLVIDPDYNCRDMKSAETQAHIDWLADEIGSQGFNPEMPLTVKRRGDEIIVIRGHCRHAACLKIIERGVELIKVPVMQIASGTSDIDLIFDQEASNYGLRLDPLARARLVLKAKRLGVEDEEIARRMHWKSVASVKQHLEMLEILPEPVKEQVREGVISATEASKLVKNLPKGTDPEAAAKLIEANREENKRLGVGAKNNHKVTAKTLQRDKPKPNPKPAPKAPEPEKNEPLADVEAGVPAAPVASDQLPTDPRPALPQSDPSPEPSRPRLASLIQPEIVAYLAAIALIAEENALAERDPSETLPMSVEMFARGDRLYRQIIGDAP